MPRPAHSNTIPRETVPSDTTTRPGDHPTPKGLRPTHMNMSRPQSNRTRTRIGMHTSCEKRNRNMNVSVIRQATKQETIEYAMVAATTTFRPASSTPQEKFPSSDISAVSPSETRVDSLGTLGTIPTDVHHYMCVRTYWCHRTDPYATGAWQGSALLYSEG